jgi:hypothetical protein
VSIVAGEARGDDSREWFTSYLDDVTQLVRETARVNNHLAERWSARSLAPDDDWTVDTVTADCIEAWEHLTPLAGQGIDLWLEAVQRALRGRGTP